MPKDNKSEKPTKKYRGKDIDEDTPLKGMLSVFVLEYLKDLNGARAYLRTGYKADKGKASYYAGKLLHQPHVAKAVREAIKAREERTKVSADRVVTELAKLAFTNTGDYFEKWDGTGLYLKPSKELTLEQTAAIETLETIETLYGIKLKFKLYNKMTALQMLGEHLGMWGKKEKESDDPREHAKKIQQFVKEAHESIGGPS